MVIYEEIFKKNGLSKTQQEILKIVGSKKTLLEVGPSTGYMTNFFLQMDCIVDVVEKDRAAITKLPKKIRRVLNISIEDKGILKFLPKDYDFVILADVLEHLIDPSTALKVIREISSSKTKLLISMPNIASWVMRKQLFFKGDFEYQDSGLLDRTHLHFYTVESLSKFLFESGWKVEKVIGTITKLPFEETISKIPILGLLFKKTIYPILIEKYKNLSYYHFLVIAHK